MKESVSNKMVKSIDDVESFKWGDDCLGWFLSNQETLSIIYEMMPPHAKEIKHYHEHTWQFFFITKGEATMNIDGCDYVIKKNQFIEAPSMLPHQITNSSDTNLEFLVISVPSRPINDRIELK